MNIYVLSNMLSLSVLPFLATNSLIHIKNFTLLTGRIDIFVYNNMYLEWDARCI